MLICQSVYIQYFTHFGIDEIVYLALLFSLGSILINIGLVFWQRKDAKKVIDNVSIEFDCMDHRMLDDWSKYTNRVYEVKKYFAKLVKLHRRLVTVTRPIVLEVGIRVWIDIDISSMHKAEKPDDDHHMSQQFSHEEDR